MRVVAAMSGGVDSSVCASLLKAEGHEVIGVTLKTWSTSDCRDERSKGCCSLRDIADARSVARTLGIPHYVMDLSLDFKESVIAYFAEEYLAGRTPNPCIECNRHIKFGVLLQKAEELEASFVATGHYARKGFDAVEGRFFIQEGVDSSKDQSYVLFGQTQEQLSKTLLPMGELHKSRVRRLAEEMGLRVFDKPDSQEICFVKTSYPDFLKEYCPERLPGQGKFVTKSGVTLGAHEGIESFTVGQKKRIRLNSPEPYFVTQIHPERNEVVVGSEEDLLKLEMTVHRVNWLLKPRLGKIGVKIRYKHPKAEARIIEIEGNRVTVRFAEAQKAVTPGQAAVFYDGDRVIGGGWIETSGGVAQPG